MARGLSAAAIGVLLACSQAGSASATVFGPAAPPEYGSLTFEWLLLGRDSPDGTDFTAEDDPGDAFTPFDPSDLDPEPSSGARAVLEAEFFGRPVRFTGFAVFPLDDDKTIFDRNQNGTNATYDDDAHLNPGADVDTANSDDLFALTVEQRTTLVGTETSFIRALGNATPRSGWRLLYGTRGIYLKEDLNSVAFDSENDFQGNGNGIDRATIDTTNVLYGPQLGIEGTVLLGQRHELIVGVKGALHANFVERERSFRSDDDPANGFSDSIDDVGFAQSAEANARLNMQIGENTFFTVSGMVLWVNGVSEAADHYATVTDIDDDDIRDDGDVLFYGGTVGLTFRFPVN